MLALVIVATISKLHQYAYNPVGENCTCCADVTPSPRVSIRIANVALSSALCSNDLITASSVAYKILIAALMSGKERYVGSSCNTSVKN